MVSAVESITYRGALASAEVLTRFRLPIRRRGCGIRSRPWLAHGASLAMHPSVAFRFHTQGYVKKARRLLSDAPFGRFSEALVRRRPRIRGENFLSFSLINLLSEMPTSVDLSHS